MGMITVKEAVSRYSIENTDYKDSGDLYPGIRDGLVVHEKPEGKRGIRVDYDSAAEYLANPPAPTRKPRTPRKASTESLIATFEKQAAIAVKQNALAVEALQRAKFQGGRRDVNIELLNTINKQLVERGEEALDIPQELEAAA